MNAHATIEPETDRIARLADCFEGAWRNEEPDLAVYLALVSHASSRRALLRRLIAIDARAKKSRGRTVDPRDYGPLAAATPDVTIEAIASWIAEATVETTDDGCLVAPYTLIREIGAGSFGRVYLMTQAVTNRSVAVKVLTHWGDRKDEARLRFHREAEALGRVQHPNVVKVYEFSIFPPGFEPLPGGSYYLAMEYCPHGSLASQLTHAPAADPDAVAKSTALLARGLAAAHERGVLHRDISTNNILIAADGSYKLADFGLAKFANDDGQWTASAGVLGTPVYAAPEQLNGSAEMASDVYALGAVLFRWLTGKEPFRGTLTEILAQKTEVETAFPVPSTVPRDLQAICLKCLEKDPRSRYASAADLADDLTRHVEGETVHARWGNAVSRLTRALRRNRLDGQYEGWAPWLLVIALVGGLHNALVWYCRWNEWPDLYLAVGLLSWGIRLIVFVWGFLVTRGEAKVQERQIFWILVGNTFACTALTFSTISDRSSLFKSHAWSDFAPVHLWCISNAFCCFVLAIAPYKLRWLFIGTAAFLGAAATTIRFPDMALLTFGFAWFISFGTGAIFIWARKRRRSRSNLILSGRRSTR